MVTDTIQTAQGYFTTTVESVVILLIGFGLGILAKKLLSRIFKEVHLNELVGKVGITYNLEEILSSVISFIIYLATFVIFLSNLGITSIVLDIIVGAIVVILLLMLFVGLKDVIPNFVAWTRIQRRKSIREGRHVTVKEISGTVERIGYLETEIKTERGDILYVPNSLFMKSKFRVKKNKEA